MSGDLRFVEFSDPDAFLEATKEVDDSHMNFGLGSLYDVLATPGAEGAILLAIYADDELLLTLTRNSTHSFAWTLSIPSTVMHDLLPSDRLPAALALLATSTLPVLASDPLALNKLIGPQKAVDAFFDVWASLLRARGTHVRIDQGHFDTLSSYCKRASLAPPLALPASRPVVLATEDDLEGLAQLYIAFQLQTPWHAVVSRAQALEVMAPSVARRLVWYVSGAADPSSASGRAYAGYILVGRVTPRTIAVRNVYVSPDYRRKGIAEAMVRAVSRYYLNAPPYGVEGVPEGPPAIGVKEEINLNVADPAAERIYKRSGYLLPDRTGEVLTGGADPETGRKAWYRSVCREVVLESSASSPPAH